MSSDTALRLPRRAALLGLCALAGCGFRPVYGNGGTATVLRDAITLSAPETPDGYALRQRIEDRLGRATDVRYSLDVTIDVGTVAVAVSPEDTATRINLPGTATWVLKDAAGTVLGQGKADTFAAYSTTASTVATLTAEDDAHSRLMVALADQIVTQLIALSPRLPA
ncbi:MAG: hypothetical protein GC146_07305 [Limimaricola sp.]|uniref:LPS assembly lipoprotein LptE n=1 Tax=Limimaricola sp. TaxID=2211665 RepID=UPI001D2A92A2|nr:LPS assembly lipoprotein LptE [Limimaricola sp.]MBI1417011.1 hypothetical protein [Limimaricola sp.]